MNEIQDIKKIMAPVDFSDNSQKILKSAAMLAQKFGAGLNVVFVVQSFEDYSGFFVPHVPIVQFEEEMAKNAEEKIQQFIKEGVPAGVACESKILRGDVAEELINYAATAGIDLIVMGTHGYKGLEKILFGSVAEKVIKTAPCPVLSINPYR